MTHAVLQAGGDSILAQQLLDYLSEYRRRARLAADEGGVARATEPCGQWARFAVHRDKALGRDYLDGSLRRVQDQSGLRQHPRALATSDGHQFCVGVREGA